MSTVQSNVLQLAQAIDPFTKAGAEITSGTIGTVDGDRFTKQRLLDIYNDSRFTLFQVMRSLMPDDELAKNISAMFISAVITFTAASPNTNGPKPSGFLKLKSLLSSAGGNVPIVVLPNEYLQAVRGGTNPYYVISATNLIAFEIGTNFVIPALFGAGAGIIDYYGITNWALSDITGGSTVEIFSGEYEPILMEIAQAFASEQGSDQVNALAKKLIELKGK